MARQFGGAHLLGGYIAAALAVWKNDQERGQGLHLIEPWKTYLREIRERRERLVKEPSQFEDFLNLFYRIEPQPDRAYRVSEIGSEGFTLPTRSRDGGPLLRHLGKEEPIEILRQSEGPNVCLFNDSGTGLCAEDVAWKTSETWDDVAGNDDWAVVKASGFSETSQKLFGALRSAFGERMLIYVSAEDLRNSGFNISRSLSWESTIEDVIASVDGDGAAAKALRELAPSLVITFDYDAALFLKVGPTKIERGLLVYSTNRSEGDYRAEFSGIMPGSRTIFCSVLTAMLRNKLTEAPLAELGDDVVEKLLTYSLIAKQRCLMVGFHSISQRNMFYRVPESGFEEGQAFLISRVLNHESMFALPAIEDDNNKDDTEHAPCPVPPYFDRSEDFSDPWKRDNAGQLRRDQSASAMSSCKFTSSRAFNIATLFLESLPRTSDPFVQYVKQGSITVGKETVPLPICNIGKIRTISSLEIDSLRAIRRLIVSYVEEGAQEAKPLAVAVFGQPGTGKSFTVKSILETLGGRLLDHTRDALIECNLAGFTNSEDIVPFFQAARDKRLLGKVPILFFDEFDCQVGGAKYFWLKHFLSPIQDGSFTTGMGSHPIGKSIFVFAGGVCHSFREFRDSLESPDGSSGKPMHKGGDFLSRLKGYIDIEGIAPSGASAEYGATDVHEYFKNPQFRPYTMRRAIVLRELLRLHAKQIFSGRKSDQAEMDDAVIRAFLSEPEYLHGVRSIEAVIRMSTIGRRFSPECLPRKEQLQMHVSDRFYDLAFNA